MAANKESRRSPKPAAKPVVDPPLRRGADPAGQAREIDREEIARRAYQRYEQRGREPGHDQEDWFDAERELRGG